MQFISIHFHEPGRKGSLCNDDTVTVINKNKILIYFTFRSGQHVDPLRTCIRRNVF